MMSQFHVLPSLFAITNVERIKLSLSRSNQFKSFAAAALMLLLLGRALTFRREKSREPTLLCLLGSFSLSDSLRNSMLLSLCRSSLGFAILALSFSFLLLVLSSTFSLNAPLQYCMIWSKNKLLLAGLASSIECNLRKAATAASAWGFPAEAWDISEGSAGVILQICGGRNRCTKCNS